MATISEKMSSVQELKDMIEVMGLTGADAAEFIKDYQASARDERQREREEAERQRQEAARQRENADRQMEEAERQREEAARQREHELEVLRLNSSRGNQQTSRSEVGKSPKLPQFVDGTDCIDSYLERFERYARANEWPQERWATCLSALLTGRALDVYSGLPEEEANDYDILKDNLLNRYNLNEEGYRRKFRECKPTSDESAELFINRMKSYLDKWVKLSNVEISYEGLRDLIIKEQVLNTLSQNLATYVQERTPENLKELGQIIEKYLKAHGSSLSEKITKNQVNDGKCFNCNKFGHRAADCSFKNAQQADKRCYKCNGVGHFATDCKNKSVRTANIEINEEETVECSFGKTDNNNMPVLNGLVGNKVVSVLRDSGCSGVLVKQQFVNKNQYTGEFGTMIMADKSVKRCPIAIVPIQSPYFSGTVRALCPSDAMYDIIIGNISSARDPKNPDQNFRLKIKSKTYRPNSTPGKDRRDTYFNGKAGTDVVTCNSVFCYM